MKCMHCKKEIKLTEKYSLFGLDGDFIHDDCKSKLYEQIEIINKMEDEEFEYYMINNN